jgi:hypothetical protein
LNDGGFLFVLLIVALGCGVIGAAIAQGKGADSAAGFFLGLLLGPIGILISCFLGDPASKAVRDAELGAKKRCPECAEYVFREAKICRYCRHEFQVARPPPAAPAAPVLSRADSSEDPSFGTKLGILLMVVAVFIFIGWLALRQPSTRPIDALAVNGQNAENGAAPAVDGKPRQGRRSRRTAHQ